MKEHMKPRVQSDKVKIHPFNKYADAITTWFELRNLHSIPLSYNNLDLFAKIVATINIYLITESCLL